jgi:hypothetical protein
MNEKILQKIKLNQTDYFKNILRFDEDKITIIINHIIFLDNKNILDIILNQIEIDDIDDRIEIVDDCCNYSSLDCLILVTEKYKFPVEKSSFILLVTYGNKNKSLNCLKYLIENKYSYPIDIIKYSFDLSIVEYLLENNIEYKQYINEENISYLKKKINEHNINDFPYTYNIVINTTNNSL